MLIQALYIGIGGCIGSICRYGCSRILYRIVGDGFPYGTLAVNLIGCFLIGLVMKLSEEGFLLQPHIRLFLTIGILGGFTTFSTFSYETLELLRTGSMLKAGLNMTVSIFGCLFATWLGNTAAKIL